MVCNKDTHTCAHRENGGTCDTCKVREQFNGEGFECPFKTSKVEYEALFETKRKEHDYYSKICELQIMQKIAEKKRQSMLTHLYIIDDLASEILILNNVESMREVALYMKELIKQVEEI